MKFCSVKNSVPMKRQGTVGPSIVIPTPNAWRRRRSTEKDASRRAYLSALSEYWSLYYTLRSITLYDFEHGRPLAVDYDELIEE